ncbi:UNKNOWN [Stylonychia lemnae]|uniref:Uncharacterized protein n=1 Tax=Stylonychia lemnae TaxID=5949 RepID=A0A078B3V2_STYLE|nr:UNKNOWN [Stylonychia lemnae]|eukprot:CDW89225.1 UNKNOWN [Stylonychia lemnae]
MIGKLLQKTRNDLWQGLIAVSVKKEYNINDAAKNVSGHNLPKAPENPYRKRPLKLKYDKNDYHAFRLPSEQAFLLGGFDTEDLFGKRKGINHSPHIRSQLDLDSNLVWAYFLFCVLALGLEYKYHDEFVVLRQNFLNHDMGRFTEEDFK